MEKITLYPSNWLYNAGVVGLLRSIKIVEQKENIEKWFKDDGTVEIPNNIFDQLDVNKRYFTEKLCKCLIIGNVPRTKLVKYVNYINPSRKQDKAGFQDFVHTLKSIQENGIHSCSLCGRKLDLPSSEKNLLNQKWKQLGAESLNGFEKFIENLSKFTNAHSELLGGALTEFPNGFWNLNQSGYVCPLCSFIIIHHHLALTHLRDNSEIFVNAPSFNVMYHLNKFVREIYPKQEAKDVRQILGIGVIEYATKIQATLGVWTGMNIEVVSKYKVKKDKSWENKIEFFSLPYEIIRVLSDREIAGLLSSIGEFKVLNLVLENKFSKLVNDAYRLLRIGLKPYKERDKSEHDFLNDYLRLLKNKCNSVLVAQKMLKLYSLIERRKPYDS